MFSAEVPSESDGDITIPAKCEGCPVQCDLASELAVLKRNKRYCEAIGRAMVGHDSIFDSLVEEEVEPELAEEFKTSSRQEIGQSIEQMASRIEEIEESMADNSASCDGVAICSTTGNGLRFEPIGLCTSPLMYEIGSSRPNHVPVHVIVEHEDGAPKAN